MGLPACALFKRRIGRWKLLGRDQRALERAGQNLLIESHRQHLRLPIVVGLKARHRISCQRSLPLVDAITPHNDARLKGFLQTQRRSSAAAR